ncbi:MAG: dihydrofolate reductase family protein [bacterium]
MRKLIEITFMSLDGVMDAPDLTQAAQPYFGASEEQDYQKERLFAADALLLGRKTYEQLSQAYQEMAKSGKGAPADFVSRMNSIPKYVASTTLKEASWNAAVIHGDIADEIRKIKNQSGKDIVKYGTGPLDRVLLDNKLIDVLCIILYPFVLGHGTHLLEGLEAARHLQLSDVKRFESGTVVLEYVPKE